MEEYALLGRTGSQKKNCEETENSCFSEMIKWKGEKRMLRGLVILKRRDAKEWKEMMLKREAREASGTEGRRRER